MTKNKKSLIIAIIVYKIVLMLAYIGLEIKTFGYVNYPNEFSYGRFIASNLCFVLMLSFLPKKINQISSILNLLIFLITILPFEVVFEFSDYSYAYLFLTVMCFLIQSIIISSFSRKKRQINHLAELKDIRVKGVNLFIEIIVIGILLVSYGFPSLSNLNFYNISAVRASFVDNNIILVVLLPLFARVINILNIVHSIKERKFIQSGIFIILQIYIYLITGFKTYLFLPVLLVLMMFVEKKNIALFLTYGISLMIIVSWGAYVLFEEPMIPALFVNRLLFLPARIKLCYFDFFQNNPYVFFAQSTIGGILHIPSQYVDPIPNIIGEKYFNSFEMYCNTGYMTSGYADLGVFGMLIATLIVALIFSLMDKIKGDRAFILGVFLNYAISLNDGAIITILFSGGLLFTILYCCIVDTSQIKLNKNRFIYKRKKREHCYGTKN